MKGEFNPMKANFMENLNVTINGNRLWNQIMAFGKIGEGDNGGVTRTSFDQNDIEARKFFLKLLEQADLSPYMDAAGNIFGQIIGRNPELPAILIGSHLDTVNSGGRFDGAMGVLMGVEVLCTLKEKGIQPERTIKVVSLTDEEGARFDYAFVGSTALVGTEDSKKLKENLTASTDKDGISYLEAMKQASLEGEYFNQINPDLLEQAQLGKNDVKAYIEVHIEQGKVLENKDLAVGIVTGISGGEWAEVTIMGEAGHAGTTWMKERKDALTAASECILAIEKIALDNSGSVATVGKLEVKPGSSNVIPGRVDFTLDVRDISNERRKKTATQIYHSIRTIAVDRGLGCEIRQVQSLSSVMSSPIVMKAVKDSLQELQYPVYELPSGAAHDAMVLGELTDIGMIFVRSKSGISHHPDEWSSFEDVALGCEVLFRTTLKLL
jgi:allantoate deiminase